MAPSGLAHSSATSGIFFQDGQPQAVGNSQLSSSFRNSSNSVPGAVLNSVANSGPPSVGGSSMVTDANSGLSGGPNLQRSASFNTESYMRLPASPLSFSSNNISLSASSVMDGSCVVQQSSHQDLSSQQLPQNQHQHQQGASSATSLPSSRMGQVPRVGSPFSQDPSSLSQLYKKPRLDIKQEDMQQQVLQQLLQRQDTMQLQHNPQFQALMQQQRLRQQQQQILQSIPPVQRAQLLHQQQLQIRQQLQQQGMQQPVSAMKRPYDNGVCSRRLMQYLYHQRQRPPDNSIAYWRKFVTEYYSPRAKKRWCLSLYDNVGNHSLGVFPQATTDAWHCDICGSKSGRGFEATFEVLPRLIEIKFGSGIIDELLFLDSPRECRSPTGLMMLEYGKAVQESVYEQLRVVREGQLRIIFTPDLKIFSWEFCARRHEELLPRRLVAPQVNQLLQVAQKCQNTISECGSDGVSQEDLQANNNMVVTAGRQLAKTLELNSLNDLGFAKRYVRCLQISEVVNSMKDLMTFCRDQKVGPIDGLKNYPRHAATNKLQMQDMEKLANIQGLSSDRNAMNKMMGIHTGMSSSQMGGGANNHHPIVGRGGALSGGSVQAPSPLNNYQNMLMRQSSMNSNPNSLHQEVSSPLNNNNNNNSCNQSPSATPQGPNMPGNMQNLPVGFSNSQRLQQPPQSPSLSNTSNGGVHHGKPPQGSSQVLQQHMIQQLLQDMNNNNSKRPFGGNGWDGSADSGPGSGPNTAARPPSRSSSFRGPSNSDSSGGKFNNQKAASAGDLPTQNLHLSDEMVQDIASNDFTENGFFNNDLDDNLDFDWKA